MNKRCVLSVAVGGNYPLALQRQINSIQGYADVDHITWTENYPPNSPEHQVIPYAFKAFAIMNAIERGYTSILWMDSAVWVQGDLNKIFEIVEKNGYLIFRNGWTQANWSTDEQLRFYGHTRQEAESMPHPMACVVGLHTDSIDLWKGYIQNYEEYRGEWNNAGNVCSYDLQCMGSRHDQTILGFEAHKHGLTMTNTEGLISYDVNDKNSVLLTQGL